MTPTYISDGLGAYIAPATASLTQRGRMTGAYWNCRVCQVQGALSCPTHNPDERGVHDLYFPCSSVMCFTGPGPRTVCPDCGGAVLRDLYPVHMVEDHGYEWLGDGYGWRL